VFPTRIFQDVVYQRVSYDFFVENASEYKFNNFTITLMIPETLNLYLGAGALALPFGPFELYPSSEISRGLPIADGVRVGAAQLITTEETLSFLGIEYDIIESIMIYAQEYAIHLNWNGGEIIHNVVAEVRNELS